MKNLLLFLTLFASSMLASEPTNTLLELRLEVRSQQSMFDPFASEEPVSLTVRSSASGYLTLYQIHPDSGFAILYPQAQHRWLELEAKKEYRLVDLAQELELNYHALEGHAYVGMIITPEPIHLVPWLEQAFAEKNIKAGQKIDVVYTDELENLIEKVEADIRFRLGESQTSGFALIPLLLMPRIQILTETRRDPPRPLRYFYAGRYHIIAPELPSNFPNAARRLPPPFSFRPSPSDVNAIAPALTKDRSHNAPKPRREQKQ
ncbi:MAG: hypothetical protein AAB354_01305 [candidate division KSB1 bacterium]